MSILTTCPPSVHAEPPEALMVATLARSSAAWTLGYNAARAGQFLALVLRWSFRESDRRDIEAGHRAGLSGRVPE